jgi:pimeloyl-ACP methyl ester carboxylesterase
VGGGVVAVRLSTWIGAGAVVAGLSAAMFVGAGAASAETQSAHGAGTSTSVKSTAPGATAGPSAKHTTPAQRAKPGKRGLAGPSAAQQSSGTPTRASVVSTNRELIASPTRRGVPRLAAVVGNAVESPESIPTELNSATKAAAPRLPSLLEVVGSAIFEAIGAVTRFAAGPPVLPPGSTVTVRSSTLEIAPGHTVPADWYYPAGNDPPQRIILLQHGFLAAGPMYSYTAAYLAEHTNSVVVAPSLSSNPFAVGGFWLGGDPMYRAVAGLFLGDRTALTASAIAAGYADRYGAGVALPDEFVLAGHSLGGGLASGVAGYYAEAVEESGADNDLAGVVLLDAVPPKGVLPGALAKLDGLDGYVPVLELGAPWNFWNSTSDVNSDLTTARPGMFNGVVLKGGVHMDSMQGGNWLIQTAAYLAAGFPKPQNQAAAQLIAAGWINDMFEGRIDAATGSCSGDDCQGVYGDPGTTLVVDTDKGAASGVAIGAAAASNPASSTAAAAPEELAA